MCIHVCTHMDMEIVHTCSNTCRYRHGYGNGTYLFILVHTCMLLRGAVKNTCTDEAYIQMYAYIHAYIHTVGVKARG